MKHDRLHALTDGIFAIAMTLLVLELKVPEVHNPSNAQLIDVLGQNYRLFLSYVLSFMVLFIYWRAHNFIISVTAKNLDINLININAIFLFLIGLVPFSTYFLGLYSETQVGIGIYAGNLIALGITLLGMRIYIEKSENIQNLERTREQKINALIRMLLPVVAAILAIGVSFYSTNLALLIMLIPILLNLLNNTAELIRKFLQILRIG